MGGCSVAFCRNRFVRGEKHFFRFPKEPWRRKLWIKFTQLKNYEPKGSSTICEDHFEAETFQMKKDRATLNKEAVPTIVYKDSVKYLIRYDPVKKVYEDEVSLGYFEG